MPPIEVEPAAVISVGRGLVVVRIAILYGQMVRLVAPDAHRTVPGAGHVPAVLHRLAVFHQGMPDVSQQDSAPAMVVRDGGASRVVLRDAVAYVHVAHGVSAGAPRHLDPVEAIVVGIGVGDAYVLAARHPDAVHEIARSLGVLNPHVPGVCHLDSAPLVSLLAAFASHGHVLYVDVLAVLDGDGGRFAREDFRPRTT